MSEQTGVLRVWDENTGQWITVSGAGADGGTPGPAGPQGPPGTQGPPGPAGADGTSVTAVQAPDEATALTQSAQNPNTIYFWT